MVFEGAFIALMPIALLVPLFVWAHWLRRRRAVPRFVPWAAYVVATLGVIASLFGGVSAFRVAPDQVEGEWPSRKAQVLASGISEGMYNGGFVVVVALGIALWLSFATWRWRKPALHRTANNSRDLSLSALSKVVGSGDRDAVDADRHMRSVREMSNTPHIFGQGMQQIDLEWVTTAFSSIVEAFGAGPLARQIEAFNDALGGTSSQDQEMSVLAIKMLRAGVERPHHALLNLLSEACDARGATNEYICRFVAPLHLLEARLAQLKRAGFRLTEYRTMIVAPHSFDSLVAEVDVVGGLLDCGGAMKPHVLTGEKTATNYDVHWSHADMTMRGDVKFFRDWLRKPENPILETLSLLLRGDLASGLTVKVVFRELSKEMLIDVALETLELYRVATGVIPCPAGVRVVVDAKGTKGAIATQDAPERLVREVLPMPGTRPESILVIESGMGDGDDDENSIRRNLQKAAQQVPRAESDRELSLVFIGSAIPGSAADVNSTLFGRPVQNPETGVIVQTPGYFSEETEEVDLAHIQAVLFFSIVYESVASCPSRAHVRRVARAFVRPAALAGSQANALRDATAALSASGEIDVHFRPAGRS